MKIVQSYWSLPSQSSLVEEDGRQKGGWAHKKYHYYGMALSCLLLRRFYSEVELITDTVGKKLLIDVLGLPYTSVSTDLDQFIDYPAVLWSLPKLYAYSIQTSPFLHVDGDVFIWEAFNPTVLQAAVVAQSPEIKHEHMYKDAVTKLCDLIGYVPTPFAPNSADNTIALNAGVLGGTDVEFLSSYALAAISIIKDNIDIIKKNCNTGIVNIALEQLLLYNFCKMSNKEIAYVIPVLSHDFKEVINFHTAPVIQTFIHLIGKAKKSLLACEQVEFRLKYEFPDYYDRITEVINHEFASCIFTSNKEQETNSEPYFARTKLMLKNKGIYVNEYINYSIIKKVIQIINNQCFLSYARDIYNLDKCKMLIKNISDDVDLWLNKQKVYKLLEKRSAQYVLNCPLTLTHSIYIVQTTWNLKTLNNLNLYQTNFDLKNDNSHYILIQKKGNIFIEEELFGWDQLLIRFYNNAITGYELLMELKDSVISEQVNLEQSVLDFILTEMVYANRLVVV